MFETYFFNLLGLVGGLALFLFGMNVMGNALERRAGNGLKNLLGKLTSNKFLGFLTGVGVTAIIQSSSATTVMVVGFVNSGLMSLGQAINVIMGANVGTTVTSWILSLGGIDGDSFFVQMLKPTSFTPILALVGIVLYMFCKSQNKKDTGTILLGFATLMFGMDAMSGSVAFLEEVEGFRNILTMFENPILGVLAGAFLTAVIQSSSASVGILQALASGTSQVTFGSAIPIIMGQNIGTCITALLSSVGTTKNAKRAAVVHLAFNVIGTVVCLVIFAVIKATLNPAILGESVGAVGIPVCHSIFNVACTLIMLPLSKLLEKIATLIVPDAKLPESTSELDDRLLNTPAVALERCRTLTCEMAEASVEAIDLSLRAMTEGFTPELLEACKEKEDLTDHYEDILGTYLVKLSSHQIGEKESAYAAMLLRVIGDCERIADHSMNIIGSAEEMAQKNMVFTEKATKELGVLYAALRETLTHTLATFRDNDMTAASHVEPLEEVIDNLKDEIRSRHITRLQSGNCTIEAGFVLSDLLTNLERVSDHCSNIVGCVIDSAQNNLNLHESTRLLREEDSDFEKQEHIFAEKYSLASI